MDLNTFSDYEINACASNVLDTSDAEFDSVSDQHGPITTDHQYALMGKLTRVLRVRYNLSISLQDLSSGKWQLGPSFNLLCNNVEFEHILFQI